MNNKNVIGYSGVVNLVAITSNTVFVKTVAKTENTPVFGKNSDLQQPDGKKKRFVPIYHYCNKPGRICPKCVKYKNTLMMNKI